MAQFGTSKRGKKTLIYNCYEFWQESTNQRGQITWKCCYIISEAGYRKNERPHDRDNLYTLIFSRCCRRSPRRSCTNGSSQESISKSSSTSPSSNTVDGS